MRAPKGLLSNQKTAPVAFLFQPESKASDKITPAKNKSSIRKKYLTGLNNYCQEQMLAYFCVASATKEKYIF
jgi:hypothetical protein